MPSPTFVNAGALATEGFGTSVTPSLPASLVSGNLLVAVACSQFANRAFTFPAGWTPIGSGSHANDIGFDVAARIVDGSEGANITITWTGSQQAKAKVFQFSGNLAALMDAINTAVVTAFGNNATFTNAGVVTTAPNSVVLCLVSGNNGTSSGTPTSYTQLTNEANLSAYSEDVATEGGSSAAISSGFPFGMHWVTYAFEIRSEAPSSETPSEPASESSETPSEPASESSETPSEPASEIPSEPNSESSETPDTSSESETESEPDPAPIPPPIQCVVVQDHG